MSDRDLEIRSVQILENSRFLCDRAYYQVIHARKGGFANKKMDHFHVFDILALRQKQLRMIQVCVLTTLQDHKRKIDKFFPYYYGIGDMITVEIWAYYKENGRWKIQYWRRLGREWLDVTDFQKVD